MRTFLFRRLLQTIPLLLGISGLTFLLLQLAPGDFLATMADNPQVSSATLGAMRHRFGLDQPGWVQYLLYLRNIFLHLDFGESFSRHQPVIAVLRTALAKGLPERDVVVRHALRNALNPLITLFGFTLGSLVSGSFVAETIFSWPGLGSLTLEALTTQDQYLVMGSVLMASAVLIAG